MATRRRRTVSGSPSRRYGTGTRGWLWSLALGVGALGIAMGATDGWAQTNLGVAATQIAAPGQWVVFLADERAQQGSADGCDFNGDGGCADQVPFIYDTVAGTTTHLTWAARNFKAAGNFAAFGVSENASGGQDLNNDGGTGDVVLFVYDLTSGTGIATNTGQALGQYEMDGQHVVFTTREKAQHADLNDDGGATDKVLQVWHLDLPPGPDSRVNTGLAGNFFAFAGDWVAMHVSERQQGDDLNGVNGDGDLGDDVLHLYQISTDTTINRQVAVRASRISPEACIFTVSERRQFGTDLNGDDDIDDDVVQVYVFATSQLYTPNIAVGRNALAVGHTYAAFSASERSQGPAGTDLNGDSDAVDDVLYIIDLATGTVTNLATSNPATSSASRSIVDINGDNVDDFVVFVSSEVADGKDYNGDEDTRDLVLRAYDLSSRTFTNIASVFRDWNRQTESLGLGTFGEKYYDVNGSRVVFVTKEAAEGGTDLNLDGDANDAVVQVYDLATKSLVSTHLASEHYEARGNLIAISAPSLYLYDMSGGLPGVTTAVIGAGGLPVAVARSSRLRQGLAVGPTVVAYRASERAQGRTDLNKDFDTSDSVVGYVAP